MTLQAGQMGREALYSFIEGVPSSPGAIGFNQTGHTRRETPDISTYATSSTRGVKQMHDGKSQRKGSAMWGWHGFSCDQQRKVGIPA